ncbi:MAG: cobalamin-dependent protein [Candidatus Omnitrophica bacterium]|nr:cobalamin-dependent protein [Candidatus Omnitrophota bacterium]
MKITFVHLGREHLGIEYLSSALKKAGHQISLAYDSGLFGPEDNVFYIPYLERVFNQKDKVIAKIESSNPDLVAFTIYTSTYRWACEIARIIKQRMGLKTVFGGIHASLVPEVVIKNDVVDFVIVGEGELALLDLVNALSSKKTEYQIPNLWYKKEEKIIKNSLRPLIENLDSLPFPDKELFENDINYKDDYVIMASRGCVFNCSYCCESFMNRLYHNGFYRRRSIDSIIEELRIMKKRYRFREVMFNDALFFTDKAWLEELLRWYRKEIGVPFRCFGKVTYFSEELGRLLKENGCYCIEFGMQTVNEPLKRRVLNRYETNQRAQETFRLCDRLKLHYDIDHMFGLPGEEEEDYILGSKFYSQLRYLNRIKCHNLTYFPKMEILESAQEEGRLDKKEIVDIEEGNIEDFFHCNSFKDETMIRINKNFQVFYKILPLLPSVLVSWILKRKLYRKFYLIPSFVVIFLQLLVALRSRDYRYIIYFKYYPLRIRRSISR